MSPPVSHLFAVHAIPNAGRGVLAREKIPAGTVLLSSEPAAVVIFRQYRKEVCAYDFEYDLGRTLKVRDNATGKVFCSPLCQEKWLAQEGEIGVEAWRRLHAFTQTKAKAISDTNSDLPTTTRPKREAVRAAWVNAGEQLRAHLNACAKSHKARAVPRAWTQTVDPDILGFYLSGILFHCTYANNI
jgi:hypothetical protein